MHYKRPVITQEMMVRLWASYKMYVADCETVLRLLRTGSEIEHGSMQINYEGLRNAIPTSPVLGIGEEVDNMRAQRMELLSHLLDGVDIAALKRSGVPATANYQRHANARLFWEGVTVFKLDLATSRGHLLALLRDRKDWKLLDAAICYETHGRWEIFRLRVAAALYRMRMPIAQQIALSGLEGLQIVFEGMARVALDLLENER